MADVFISYKSERRAAAEHLAEILADYGYSVWWDYGLISGADFGPQIERELRAAKAVIVLWCALAKDSKWVRSEATLASRLNTFLPARIDNVELSLDFLLDQTVDLSLWDGAPQGAALAPLLSELGRRVRPAVANLEGLARTERAWRRFGAPPLAKFALIDPVETRVRERSFAGHVEAGAAAAATTPSALAWAQIADSLDVADYDDFARHFPGSAEVMTASRHKRQLDAWAQVARGDPQAIGAFLQTGVFAALERVAREAMARAAEVQQQAFERAREERRARDAAEAEARRKAEEARAARLRPGSVWRDKVQGLPEALFPELVTIPAGKFVMGSPPGEKDRLDREGPQREVTIQAPFALGKYAVTVDEFAAFVAATKHDTGKSAYIWIGAEWKDTPGKGWRDPGFTQTGRHPVCCVSWEDAQAYVAWLNACLESGSAPPPAAQARPEAARSNPYRLPSEAEWEYACRAGETKRWSFGDDESQLGAHAWFHGNSGSKTHPVGEKLANRFGLHDMHGNVWEWCADCWNANYSGLATDGSAITTGDCSNRVYRGGSWDYYPQWLRSASRNRYTPTLRDGDIGFRVARTL
jgi:formylglycine-generating enzyme required for sulfatase activity